MKRCLVSLRGEVIGLAEAEFELCKVGVARRSACWNGGEFFRCGPALVG